MITTVLGLGKYNHFSISKEFRAVYPTNRMIILFNLLETSRNLFDVKKNFSLWAKHSLRSSLETIYHLVWKEFRNRSFHCEKGPAIVNESKEPKEGETLLRKE